MGRTSIVADTNFHELPRRRLQQLCKKHGVPANKTNAAMADALTDIYRNGNLPPPSPYTATPRPRRTRNSEPAMPECEESEYSDSQLGSQLATPSGSVCMGSYGARFTREQEDYASPGANAFPRKILVVSEEEEDSASSALRASCSRLVESTLVGITLPTIEEKGECLEAIVLIEDQQVQQSAAEPQLSEQEEEEKQKDLATFSKGVSAPEGVHDSAPVSADVASNTSRNLGAADGSSKTSVGDVADSDDVGNQELEKKELDEELCHGAHSEELDQAPGHCQEPFANDQDGSRCKDPEIGTGHVHRAEATRSGEHGVVVLTDSSRACSPTKQGSDGLIQDVSETDSAADMGISEHSCAPSITAVEECVLPTLSALCNEQEGGIYGRLNYEEQGHAVFPENETVPSLEALASALEDPVSPVNLGAPPIVEVYLMDGNEVTGGEDENLQTSEVTSHAVQEFNLVMHESCTEAALSDVMPDSPTDGTVETLWQGTFQGCSTEAMDDGGEEHELQSGDQQALPTAEVYLYAPSTNECLVLVDNSLHYEEHPAQDVPESDLLDGMDSSDVLQVPESALTSESFVVEEMDVDVPPEEPRTKEGSAENNQSLIIESRHEECPTPVQRKNLYKKTPFVGEQTPSLRALKRALKEKQAQRDGLINKKRSAISSSGQQLREFGTPLRVNGGSVRSIHGNGSDEVQRKEAQGFDSPSVPPVQVYIDDAPDCVEGSDAVTDQGAEDTKPVSVAAVSRESARLVGQKHKPGKHVPVFFGRRQWMEKAIAKAAQKRLEGKEKLLSVAPTGHLMQDKENVQGPAGGRTAEMLKKHQEGYKTPLTVKSKEKARQVSKKLAQSRRKVVLDERRGLPVPEVDSPPAESGAEIMLPESTTSLIQ